MRPIVICFAESTRRNNCSEQKIDTDRQDINRDSTKQLPDIIEAKIQNNWHTGRSYST